MGPVVLREPWETNRRYGIVIDAGSSGTRIQIYSWKDPNIYRRQLNSNSPELNRLPVVERGDEKGVNWQLKHEPGISSFATNIDGLAGHLKPLMKFAMDVVPADQISSTPIFLQATAGMRLLPSSDQHRILERICSVLQNNYSFDVGECSAHVQVISGEKEGLFGWIAVNYLLGGFDDIQSRKAAAKLHRGPALRETFGFLDMGGASAQIAYEPSEEYSKRNPENLMTVEMRSLRGEPIKYNVFSTTFLGYGTNEARRRYVEQIIERHPTAKLDPNAVITDPCLPLDRRTVENRVHPARSLVGEGNYVECMEATVPLLNMTTDCPESPCIFNGVHAPDFDISVLRLVGISEWWVNLGVISIVVDGVYQSRCILTGGTHSTISSV